MIDRLISDARTVCGLVAMSGAAAVVWTLFGCPGLTALGLN